MYVSPHDVEGLAAAIARTQEPSLRATMIEEGLKWAQRFTQEQMARETMECYRKVLTKEIIRYELFGPEMSLTMHLRKRMAGGSKEF